MAAPAWAETPQSWPEVTSQAFVRRTASASPRRSTSSSSVSGIPEPPSSVSEPTTEIIAHGGGMPQTSVKSLTTVPGGLSPEIRANLAGGCAQGWERAKEFGVVGYMRERVKQVVYTKAGHAPQACSTGVLHRPVASRESEQSRTESAALFSAEDRGDPHSSRGHGRSLFHVAAACRVGSFEPWLSRSQWKQDAILRCCHPARPWRSRPHVCFSARIAPVQPTTRCCRRWTPFLRKSKLSMSEYVIFVTSTRPTS